MDLLCPNESEAEAAVGYPLQSPTQVADAARELAKQGTAAIAVTLRQQGTLLCQGGRSQPVAAYPVQAVDTTAAGDAFAGALAVHWAEQDNLLEAVRFGNAAGALAASREGAQPGMAFRHEIENLWRSLE